MSEATKVGSGRRQRITEVDLTLEIRADFFDNETPSLKRQIEQALESQFGDEVELSKYLKVSISDE